MVLCQAFLSLLPLPPPPWEGLILRLSHERLLQPVATSVQANWPITGRLSFFVKRDFDLKFISRAHVNMANVAAVFDLVSQKFCIRELNARQKEAIIQFLEKQRDVFINLPTGFGKSLTVSSVALGFRRHA